jgi:hypothetical protein
MLNAVLTIGVAMGAVGLLATAGRAETAGVVSNVLVVSDKVADVSSVDAWKKAFIKEGMSDREKALAVWKGVVSFQHQNAPPAECLHSDNAVVDPIKMFNVYGYSLCSVFASHVAAMAREVGLEARNQTIVRHCVAEIYYEGEWHMLDASLVNYFPKPDGKLASVDEIIAATGEFYKKFPELKGNAEGLEKFRKDGRWKTEGPPLLAACPFYKEDGLLVANWPWQCGWPETMREYDGTTQFIFEPGYSMGYRVNVQLRQGEKLTRNWSNKGLHVNMGWKRDSAPPPVMNLKVGEGGLAYAPEFGDLAPGRVGNGVHEYEIPLKDDAFVGGMLSVENLASKGAAVAAKDRLKIGTMTFRMPSSYVYLTGEMALGVTGTTPLVEVSISTNNGLDWNKIKTITNAGKHTIDLKPELFARYDYQVKLDVGGHDTALNRIYVRHDVQHSQRALPALAQGENTITFSSGNEGTVTVEGSTDPANKGKQNLYTEFHAKSEGMKEPKISVASKQGWVEFPIKTPADMKRLRIFSFYRAKAKGDFWKVEASFDAGGGGKTWRDVGRMEGPYKAMGKGFVVNDIPANTREARVRFTGIVGGEAALLFNVRIDADYDEPRGGAAPVQVTYVWDEAGTEKRETRKAKSGDTWKIICAQKPVMKSITVER